MKNIELQDKIYELGFKSFIKMNRFKFINLEQVDLSNSALNTNHTVDPALNVLCFI